MKTLFFPAFVLVILGMNFAEPAVANILDANIERVPSVSQNYDSRNVFANPSALGYEAELNGASLMTAFQYGFNVNLRDDLAFSLSYGVLGFGLEQLSAPEGQFSRYGFSLALPLGPWLFIGGRYSFTLSDAAVLANIQSADLGLQVRASQYVDFGFVVKSLNQPLSNGGTKVPARYVLGTTISPLSAIQISADVWTDSDTLAQNFGYVGTLSVEPWKGVKIRGGYHQLYQFFAGLQLDLEHGSLIGTTTPGVPSTPVVAGIQMSSKPYASALNPSGPLKLEVEPDMGEEPVRPALFAAGKTSMLEVLEMLDKARTDHRVNNVMVRLDSFPLGLASAQEFFEALWKLRQSGKKVDVYLQNAGLKEYLIASAANTIHMEPTAELKFLGIRSEHYYTKGFLDKVGIEGDFLAKGEYKSAPEMFTRKEASPISRKATLDELKTAESEIILNLSKTGRITSKTWEDLLKQGILSAETAVNLKLVDKIGYYSRDLENDKHCITRKSLVEKSSALAVKPRVAVIVAAGDIMGHEVGALTLAGYPTVTPEKLERFFKRALSDPRTDAILLRVSSPGGEIVASDEMASLVQNARTKKPVYVSMGDVAASGGYYISAPAEKIFADPLTFTGSIGVFLGKFNLKGLYKMLDLNKEILGDTPYPGLYSEDRGWTEPERVILGKRLNDYYSGFVNYVSKNRSLSFTEADESAKGRVWLGGQAKAKKLVDELGGYLEALKATAKNVGLDEGDYEPWVLTEGRGLLGLGAPNGSMLGAALGEVVPRSLLRSMQWAESLRRTPFLYWTPFQISGDSR